MSELLRLVLGGISIMMAKSFELWWWIKIFYTDVMPVFVHQL